VNVLLGRQVDRLTLENDSLQDTLVSREDELDQTRGRLIMEATVRDWLQPLLGREVDRLAHQLVPRVVDGRQVSIDGRVYVLRADLVVVAPKTGIYVTAVGS